MSVNVETEVADELMNELIEQTPANKFRWIDRLGCIEAVANEYMENGEKFDSALRAIRLRDFALNASKMLVKQKNQLRRDVVKRSKEIQLVRDSAGVGDIVRVPKLIPNPLIGGFKRDGKKLVEAEIIRKDVVSSAIRYTVKRLQDGEIQAGNGHMIKALVRQSLQAEV